MDSMEWNKIFAAILVAGIIASLTGFVAKEAVHPHKLKEDAIAVEGSEGGASGGSAKPKLPEPILAMIADADIVRGQKVSKACAACHSFDKGGPDGTGPNLWNIVNRSKGGSGGFAYSDVMASADGVWDYQALNHFLWKPKAYMSGTKMNYIGLKKPEDRAALVAWLRTLADSPASNPSSGAIDAEIEAFAPKVEAEVAEETEKLEGMAEDL